MNVGTAAERLMKHALDGQFFEMQSDGTFRSREVKRDFLPDYAPGPLQHRMRKRPESVVYRYFTPGEDEIIIGMSRAGRFTVADIAKKIGRSLCSVTGRKHRLIIEGKL